MHQKGAWRHTDTNVNTNTNTEVQERVIMSVLLHSVLKCIHECLWWSVHPSIFVVGVNNPWVHLWISGCMFVVGVAFMGVVQIIKTNRD